MSSFDTPRIPEADPFLEECMSHMDALYGVACRLTRNPTEAEDLVQDALVKAMRARTQFQPGTNLKAWLFRILTNTFINKYRRGGLERSVLDPEQIALMPIVEGEVRRALDALPPEFRLAVILCDVEEFSYEEIADIMGCPIGTVMSRLHRGRKLLQKSLYSHALAMGIVKSEAVVGAGAPQKKTSTPSDLDAYRARKRGVA